MSRTFLTRVGAAALSALSTLAPPSAKAATRAEHTVSWYVAHAAERDAILRRCNDDRSLDGNGDCQNATAASAQTAVPGWAGPDAFATANSPEVYRKNNALRAMTLSACNTNLPPPAAWCRAARQAQSEIH